jgi:beta-N-acetylhexosaminidase
MAGVGLRDGVPDVVAAVRAGVDLLLTAADPVARGAIEDGLVAAAGRRLFDAAEMAATERRLATLREWLASFGEPPEIDVVGCQDHLELAAELATRSMTVVRDPARLLPIRWSSVRRILAVMPRPSDLTPADTSSTVRPALAAALRRYHGDVDEVIVEPGPDQASIAAVRTRAATADLAVIGTLDAHRLRSQLDLVAAISGTGTPTIVAAMRGPWDVSAVPAGVTALASYSILPGSLEAFAAVLDGAAAPGRLPVAV